MSQTDPSNRISDFRDTAVFVSGAALGAKGVTKPETADLSKLGTSLCILAPGDAKEFRRKLGIRMILLTVFGFGGVIAGALLAKSTDKGEEDRQPASPILWVGLGASACGILCMCSALRVQRWTITNHLQRHAALRPAAASRERPIVISIEDPQTFHRLKLVTDDVAELYLDGQRRLAVLEGFSHRYVIRAEDVVDCFLREGGSSTAVVIVFRVGGKDVLLSLVLVYNNIAIAFKRKLHLPGSAPLAGMLERSLEIQVRPAG